MGGMELPFKISLTFFFVPRLDFLYFVVGIMDMLLGEEKKSFLVGSKLPVSALVSRRGLHLTHFIIHVPILLYGTCFSLLQYLAKILKSAGMPPKVPSKECAIKTPSVCTLIRYVPELEKRLIRRED